MKLEALYGSFEKRDSSALYHTQVVMCKPGGLHTAQSALSTEIQQV